MQHQKEPQGHRLEVAGKAFKTLPRLLGKAGIRFSGRHNAACGMADFVRVLVSMCRDRSCASGAAGALAVRHGPRRVPSSTWFLSRIGGRAGTPAPWRAGAGTPCAPRCAGPVAPGSSGGQPRRALPVLASLRRYSLSLRDS